LKFDRKIVFTLALAGFVASCGGPMLWTSSRTATTDPASIRLYTQTPRKYQRLGTVTHLLALDAPPTGKSDGTAVFKDMLTEAGSMGADGLLLVDDTTMADSKTSMTWQGKAYSLPMRAKSQIIIVQAIYVIEP